MLAKLGIEVVHLDLPFRLNHVNCLSAEGKDGWAIIDTGLKHKKMRAVSHVKLNNKELKDMIVSHYHSDHFGYARGLQQLTGVSVYMSDIDEDSGKTVWEPEFINTIKENYKDDGVPAN